MFGAYDIPLKIEQEGISLSVEKDGETLVYRRECADEKVEKTLLAGKGKLLIHPVEPLNKPKALTSNLLIEFDKTLMAAPKETSKIFLTFPVEIGVFISKGKSSDILDVMTLAGQKFTLYGDPKHGVICKYWKSEVFSALPSVNPIHEGVIGLDITNTTAKWLEVTQTVFNAQGMRIYYDDTLVSMKANMKIMGKVIAETDFIDSPLRKGMAKSLELYVSRKLQVVVPKFVMEAGL